MDKIQYLNASFSETDTANSLSSGLLSALSQLKQARGSAGQWVGIINGLTQKGVKGSEIEDSDILVYLKTRNSDDKLNKDEVMRLIAQRLPRIKRVTLAMPRYPSYTNMSAAAYKENLYVLCSEAMTGDDQIEDLMYRIEGLGFDPSPLMEDPELIDRLESEMALIKKHRPNMYEFSQHHFSSQIKDHGKNLLAHSRVSMKDGLCFIEEIQSDWAQRGRAANWTGAYPKAPLVTNTEQWAGVVLRDVLHTAAHDPSCTRVAWIMASMRNGFTSDQGNSDGLDLFYKSIIKKLAEKLITKAGGRVVPLEVATKNGQRETLGFEMTDPVRAALQRPLPLYSRDAMLSRQTLLNDPERNEERSMVIQECKAMLGSAHTIRFVAKLYDHTHNNEVPGSYVNKAITLSLRAKHIDRAARHEAWHFAEENFLLPHEQREMRLAFDFNGELNQRTRAVLRELGSNDAADQCIDHKECAAHAFSLWCEGRLEVAGKPKGIFEAVAQSLSKLSDWLEEKVFGIKVQTPEDLFTAMRSGALAAREKLQPSESMEQAPHSY